MSTVTQPIRIVRSGLTLGVASDVLNVLPPLVGERVTAVSGPLRRVDAPLMGIGADLPNSGLVPILRHWASTRGMDLVVSQSCNARLTLPAPAVDANLQPIVDPSLTAFLVGNETGLIEYGNSVEPAVLIADICRAFPTATIAVLRQNRGTIKRLRARLVALGINIAQRVSNCDREVVQRIVIGTCSDMAAEEVKFEKRELVIAVDALEALGWQAQMPLMDPGLRCRLVGLLPARCHLSPYEQDCLMAVFGPAIHSIPRSGHQQIAVSVGWLAIDAPRVSSRLDDTDLQRAGYWYHHARNRRIARLIEPRTCGESSTVAPLATGADLSSAMQPARRIMVVVDALEHAIALAELLPDAYSIIAGNDPLLDGLSVRQNEVYQTRAHRWSLYDRCIVTTSVLNSRDITTYDVLVWAAGGPGPIPVDNRKLIRPAGESRPLLIVDIADRHHPQLRRWARSRHEYYEQLNWFAPGISTTVGRIERFLRCERNS